MVKVLISPLGAGDYRTAHYKFTNSSVYETPFIAAALANHLKVDKVILIGTDGSMWHVAYDYFKDNKPGTTPNFNRGSLSSELVELGNAIDDYLLKEINPCATGGSCCKLIKYGRNEDELWANFDIFMEIINDEVQDGGEIYLDITHSFRSIPLFMYIMMEFIQTLGTKDIELAGLYYGMFEGSSKEKYNGKEIVITPVVDLKPLFEISKWIRGVYDFTNYGNGYLISKLLSDEDSKVSHSIGKVSTYVDANYLGDLREEINKLKTLMEDNNIGETKFLKYFKPHIDEFLNRFNNVNSDYQFQLAMAKWHFDNKKYSAGYLCLTDSILWGLCEIYGINTSYKNRELMKSIIRDDRIKLYEKYSQLNELRNIHVELTNIRNKIAHADVSDAGKSNDAIEKTDELYNKVKETLRKDEFLNLPKQLPMEKLVEFYGAPKNGNIKSACQCLSIIIMKKLCEVYGLDSKKQYHYELMNTLLLNRRLHNNNILPQLNDVYHKITRKARYLTYYDFEEYFSTTKDILNNSRLKDIPKDIPLNKIKRTHENYIRNRQQKG